MLAGRWQGRLGPWRASVAASVRHYGAPQRTGGGGTGGGGRGRGRGGGRGGGRGRTQDGRRQVIQKGTQAQKGSQHRLALDSAAPHRLSAFMPWVLDDAPPGPGVEEAATDIEEGLANVAQLRSPLDSRPPFKGFKAVGAETEKVRAQWGKGLDGSSALHQEVLDRGRNVLNEMGVEQWPAGEVPENSASIAPVELLGFFDKFVVEKLRIHALGASSSHGLNTQDPSLLHQNEAFAKPSGLTTASLWPELYNTYKELQSAPDGDRTLGTVKHHPTTVTHNLRRFMKETFGIHPDKISDAVVNLNEDFYKDDTKAYQLDPRNPVDFSRWMEMMPGKQEEYITGVARKGDPTPIKQVYTHKLVKDSPAAPPTTIEFLRHAAWVTFMHLNASGDVQKPLYDKNDLPAFDPPFVFPETIDPTVQVKKEWVEPTRECVLCGADPPPLEPMNVPLLMHFVNTNGLIIPRRQTGTCAKHQRKIKRVVARAVAMGVIDYKQRRFNVYNPFHPKPKEVEEPEFEEYDVDDFEKLKKQLSQKGAAMMGTPHDLEDLEL